MGIGAAFVRRIRESVNSWTAAAGKRQISGNEHAATDSATPMKNIVNNTYCESTSANGTHIKASESDASYHGNFGNAICTGNSRVAVTAALLTVLLAGGIGISTYPEYIHDFWEELPVSHFSVLELTCEGFLSLFLPVLPEPLTYGRIILF